ncbi:MAG TPA: type 1 glutamine amidotransferase domain-containing protein [Edaphobacter sp.]|nr:type 1 glutamine amidotransferase domain-containing protein [Edaphobacter sp.]
MSNQSGTLNGMRVAILATQGFEQVELTKPKEALEKAGAKVEVISPASGIKSGKIKGWNHTDWGDSIKSDVELSQAKESNYSALMLPGGVMNPDKLRMDPQAVAFVKSFVSAGKPIAAICHGPWTLIEADAVRGKTMTSWPSLQTDLRNAGAKWVDQEVAEDHGLVTSRKPDDLPAFNQRMIEVFGRAAHRAAA